MLVLPLIAAAALMATTLDVLLPRALIARPSDVVPVGFDALLPGHATLVSSKGGRFGLLQLDGPIAGTPCFVPDVALAGPARSIADGLTSVALGPNGDVFVGDDDGRIWRVTLDRTNVQSAG